MTKEELEAGVARALGEPIREIRRRGFHEIRVERLIESGELPKFVDWDELDRSRPRIFPE